jgi:hypothetical protein
MAQHSTCHHLTQTPRHPHPPSSNTPLALPPPPPRGSTFQAVCEMTDLYEGSIIRACRRLDELMQQLQRAAAVVGNEQLAAKFEESNATIRRDIMFAASLYI